MYDLAIIGGGLSGLIAGYQGAANGLKTIIIEKGHHIGGSGNYVEGFFAVGTKYQKGKGLSYDPKQIYQEEMDYSHFESDPKTVMTYIKQSKRNLEYLQDKVGVEITDVFPMGNSKATWHIMKGFGQEQFSKHIIPSIKKLGGKIITATKATEVLKDDDGKISGVTIENIDNHEYHQIPVKAVIIATGGFLNNTKLLGEETNYNPDLMIPVNCGKTTGDGEQMAWKIGAQRDRKGAVMAFGGYIKDPDKPPYYYYTKEINNAATGQGLLMVNERGERFTNEATGNPAYTGNAVLQQNRIYAIADQNAINILNDKHLFLPWAGFQEDASKPYANSNLKKQLNEAITNKAKFLHVANSIDDLSRQLNLPNLSRTIARYNELAGKGEDDDFFVDSKLLHSIKDGPFYAFNLGVGTLTSLGGLKTDMNNGVLDNQGKEIPGLYAVGTDAYGKMVGDTYGYNIPGSCAGYCLYSGLTAANAVKEYIG